MIALTSSAVLLYQVAITRILSVTLWYHFAFLAVSLAMLAMGAPGVWFALREPGEEVLPRSLLLAGLATPASVAILFAHGGSSNHPVLLTTLVLLVPLMAMGSAVVLLLLRAPGASVGSMYGADLLGATAGALLVVPLMGVIRTPQLVAGCGLLPLLGLAVLGRRRAAGAGALAVLGLLLWGTPLELRFTKAYGEDPPPILERWSPTARLAVFEVTPRPGGGYWAFHGWGPGSRYRPEPIASRWLEQDGNAGTPLLAAAERPAHEHLLFDVTSIAFQVGPPGRVCVIGAGGGRDVVTAHIAGASRVDAVELNRHLVDLVRGELGEYTGDPYGLPGVHPVIAEGRSYLSHHRGPWDRIQISMIDSWAATAAGAYAFSENFLYTTQAFRLFWSRLSPTGLLSVSRWIAGPRTLEAPRLALLAREALRLEGVADPDAHLAIYQGRKVATAVISREPASARVIPGLDRVAEERGFLRLWPRGPATPPDAPLPWVLEGAAEEVEKMGFDLSPPTDDRPFFFMTRSLGAGPPPEGGFTNANRESVRILEELAVGLTLLAVLLFFSPFLLRGRLERPHGFWTGSLYFLTIGAAFMLVELPLIQKGILFLGHPSYATGVILASLLLGAGLGARAAAHVGLDGALRRGVLLPLLLLAFHLAGDALFTAALGSAFEVRIGLIFGIGTALGYPLGFALPLGLRVFGDRAKAWLWAMNGTGSVLASATSLGIAMAWGFSRAFWLAMSLYLLAWILLRRGRRIRNDACEDADSGLP